MADSADRNGTTGGTKQSGWTLLLLIFGSMALASLMGQLAWLGLAAGLGLAALGQAIAMGRVNHPRATTGVALWARVTGGLGALLAVSQALGLGDEAPPATGATAAAPTVAATVPSEIAPPPAAETSARLAAELSKASDSAAKSDFTAFIPVELPGFALVRADRHPKVVPRMPDFPQTGVWAHYLSRQGDGTKAELLVEKNAEPLSDGRKLMLGKTPARASTDEDIAVSWRSRELLGVLWLYPAGSGSKNRARKKAVALAKAAAEWTEGIAAGALDATQKSQHAAAIESAVSSDSARELAAKRRLADVMRRLPADAVQSVSLRGDELTVVVAPHWLLLPRSVRREQARKMWKSWATVNSPLEADRSRLKITNGAGQKIGGSGMMGSSISVED